MSKKRNKKDEKRLEKIALVITTINLLTVIIGLIANLVEQRWGEKPPRG